MHFPLLTHCSCILGGMIALQTPKILGSIFICIASHILTLILDSDVCMMHLSMILDPDTCMYGAYIYVTRSLTLMHVCMMHISMILDLDPEACMYAWCMYL